MKPIKMFMFAACPHCQRALQIIDQLKKENPAYAQIPFEMIDEKLNPAAAEKYDYWYVPTFFVDGKKLHEGTVTYEQVKAVYDRALG